MSKSSIQRRLELSLQLQWLKEASEGMLYLHTMTPQMLHLDLKPGNLLLNDDLHIQVNMFPVHSPQQKSH